jgi:hypothetical protein
VNELTRSYSFTVRYDDGIVHDAVRTFVWRRVIVEQLTIWLTSLLLAASSFYFLIWGDAGWLAGVMLTVSLLPLIFVAVTWGAQHASTFGHYKRMGDPKADVTVDAEGIDIVSELGSGKMTWRNVTEVWERPRAFMVFSGADQFNTLPRETMPQEVQAYLRTRPVQDDPEQG